MDSLTSLLLVVSKDLLFLFQPGFFGSWCYYCNLKHMILCTVMDRGDIYKYLNGELKLDEFEEKDSPYPFYEEWLKKQQPVLIFFLKNYIL